MKTPERLKGKVAIVTGGGSRGELVGTGQATAILMAQHGATVLVADRDLNNANETVATIEEEGGTASAFKADVTDNASCKEMVEAAVNLFGGLHVLFNNVGLGSGGTVVDVDEDQWDLAIKVNLKSVMLTSKHAIPKMIGCGGGSIINISSIDGQAAGVWPNTPYAAAKGGIINLTRQLAIDYGPEIRVNCVCPGPIETNRVREYPPRARQVTEEQKIASEKRVAGLHRLGLSEEVAYCVLFLASNESSYVTGHALVVDGGQTITAQ